MSENLKISRAEFQAKLLRWIILNEYEMETDTSDRVNATNYDIDDILGVIETEVPITEFGFTS
jgi:hypothetical protein